MPPSERAGYILMERLHPVVVQNTILREGQLQDAQIVSELGVFGLHIQVNGKEIANINAGTLLRSKLASEDDGGVAAGVAVLDSVLLA
jgi:glutathione synthase